MVIAGSAEQMERQVGLEPQDIADGLALMALLVPLVTLVGLGSAPPVIRDGPGSLGVMVLLEVPERAVTPVGRVRMGQRERAATAVIAEATEPLEHPDSLDGPAIVEAAFLDGPAIRAIPEVGHLAGLGIVVTLGSGLPASVGIRVFQAVRERPDSAVPQVALNIRGRGLMQAERRT